MATHERILLLQLFSNGDCLYATAVAKQIRQDYPGCHLTWAVAAYCKNILAFNPFIDELLLVDEPDVNSWSDYPPAFKIQLQQWKEAGKFTRIIQPQLTGDRFAEYDQCIRSSIFRGYDKPVTVDIAPVIVLSAEEEASLNDFAAAHELSKYRHVILLEYAPKSGQSDLTAAKAMELSNALTKQSDTAVIFASGGAVTMSTPQMINAASLSLRQVAVMTKHCSFLIGCSSGITWACTSNASKKLPMLQVLDPNAYWLNSVVNDHQRFNLPVDHIIEVTDSSTAHLLACIDMYKEKGFATARTRFHEAIKLKFRMTRGIIAKFLAKGKFKAVSKHIQINYRLHGFNTYFIKAIALGFLTAPLFIFKKD